MKNVIRWGLAAGLAAALALFNSAQAQSSTSGPAGSSGSRGDTGGPAPGGADRSTGSSTSPTPQGGAPGTSSDPGTRERGTGAGTSGTATGSTGAGSEASGRQAAAGGKVDKGLQEKLEKIHAANDAEVHLSQMAAQNAQSPEVKQFAEQMAADHKGLGEKLEQTAQSAGVSSLEGKTYQKEHERAMKDNEKLQSKTGKDFDKEFMSRIVKDHEKSVKETESAAKDAKKANQPELASFLEKVSAGMKGHLDHAKQLRASVDKGGGEQMRQGRTPPGGTGSGAPERGQSGTSGSRGDTGGPAPGGGDRSTTTSPTPGGGAPGSSSDPGQQRPRQ